MVKRSEREWLKGLGLKLEGVAGEGVDGVEK